MTTDQHTPSTDSTEPTDDVTMPGDDVAEDETVSDHTTPEGPSDGTPPPPPAPQVPAAPRPEVDAASRRNWASAAHWSALAAALLGGFAFLGPLVVWLAQKDRDRWVAAHAVESLNFQLTWLVGGFVAGIAGFLLAVVTVGLGLIVLVPLALAAVIAWFVFTVRGAIAASRAEEYTYPLTVRLITL